MEARKPVVSELCLWVFLSCACVRGCSLSCREIAFGLWQAEVAAASGKFEFMLLGRVLLRFGVGVE